MVSRFECVRYLTELSGDSLVLIWGSASDEWHHLRAYPPYMRMDLGTATACGFGLALALPHRRVLVIDSDGGLLINLGVLCTLGNLQPPNLKVFVMDNECYESIGGPPTATAGATDLAAMARGAGIKQAKMTATLGEFKKAAKSVMTTDGLQFIVAKVDKGTKRVDFRATDALEMKYEFVRYVEETENINVITAVLQKTPEHLIKD